MKPELSLVQSGIGVGITHRNVRRSHNNTKTFNNKTNSRRLIEINEFQINRHLRRARPALVT